MLRSSRVSAMPTTPFIEENARAVSLSEFEKDQRARIFFDKGRRACGLGPQGTKEKTPCKKRSPVSFRERRPSQRAEGDS